MTDPSPERKIFSLYQVAKSIQTVIADRYKSTYWIKAEMNKLNLYSHSGHAYPELVEKKGGVVIAEMKSIIWRDDFQRINKLFLKVLKEPLKDGISILFCAKISYDPKFGLSLQIFDIDPSYSLGELEREKLENIATLKREGLYEKNKSLQLALLPKRLAIISVGTSKGYADFLNVLDNNSAGYTFFKMLFPAILQGEKAVSSILKQLQNIRKVQDHFDAVAIIRGGGGDVGLSCYNDINLAKAIAGFPLPVFTGIGHSTNETVAELVSHTNTITPTALANLLLQRFSEFEVPMLKAESTILQFAKTTLRDENLALRNLVKQFRSDTRTMLQQHRHNIRYSSTSITQQSIQLIKAETQQQLLLKSSLSLSLASLFSSKKVLLKQMMTGLKKDVIVQLGHANNVLQQQQKNIVIHTAHSFIKNANELKHLGEKVTLLSPANVLQRGYSITRLNGKSVTNVAEIKAGDQISTELLHGSLESKVESISPPRQDT